jgi:outer membrane phospholipase A
MSHLRFFSLLLFAAPLSAHADWILSSATPQVEAGAQVTLDLTITNDDSTPLYAELPETLSVRFETDAAVASLTFEPDRTGDLEIAPGGFTRIKLRGTVPAEARGVATLTPHGMQTNPVAVQVHAGSATSEWQSTEQGSASLARQAETASDRNTALIDKPPPLAVSVYEPVYFIVGGDGGLNAKFQISLRFRLFDGRGRLGQQLPWLDDLYLSFSQTALWDLGELSKPFTDSSYRPRLFYANYDLAEFKGGWAHVGMETGIGHESNGKEGDDSRSYNMLYVRPTLSLGERDGLRFYAAPLIHNYIAESDNPDIADYRGNVDWLFGFGSKGGLDFWTTLRKGNRSDYGSLELNASYPLSKLSGGDLTGWLTMQYFSGYGESLLDYNRKLDSQLRLGIAVAL